MTKLNDIKKIALSLMASLYLIPISVYAEEYILLKDVSFMKYNRGIFVNSWKPRRFSGATYDGQYFPITQISENYIRKKIGSWCRVYLKDIKPVSLYVEVDGEYLILKHDSEDYLKFKC